MGMIDKVQDAYIDMWVELEALEKRFLSTFIPANPAHGPSDYDHDVKSYCVLSHAIFEEFIEIVSLIVLAEIKGDVLSGRVTLPMISLVLTYSSGINLEDVVQNGERCFSIIRKAVDDCVKSHSVKVHENHGFALKYMASLLIPIGINLPADANKVNSLDRLADARGSFAHKRSKHATYLGKKRVNLSLSPEDARSVALDCLAICEDIVNAVRRF